MPTPTSLADSVLIMETVVVQPTPFCSINCSYCYLPQRNVKSVMEQSTIVALFAKIFASGWASQGLTVIWQAGEPLVVPISFYETAFEAIEALRPPTLQLRHSIQTNGMLLRRNGCDFFKKWHVGVGVGIDGSSRLHDAHRVTRSRRGTFDQTVEAIGLLRREEVPLHVISVLSQEGMNAPQEMLDFYLSEGIEDICFNVEESEGAHVSNLFATGDAQGRFKRFLSDFWGPGAPERAGTVCPGNRWNATAVFRPDQSVMKDSQGEHFGMLNVDCHGNVSSFSPELLGLKHADYNDFIMGTINTDSLQDMHWSPPMIAMTRDVAAGVEACRTDCEYFSVCSRGAPVNKLAENGSFNSTRTSFCSLTQMVPIDLILDAFDWLGDGIDSEQSPATLRAMRGSIAGIVPETARS